MARSTLNFSAAVDAWVRQTNTRMTAVFRESTQRVISRMQTPSGAGGNMRVDTGFLRASIRVSLSEMPQIDPGAKPPADAGPGSIPYDENVAVLVIAQAQVGQTIYAGYTASYAPYVENRFGFVRLAAMEWQSIVRDVTQEAKARAAAA